MMRALLLLLLVAATLASAASSHHRRASSSSLVKDGAAQYQGACKSGVCSWLGIRYAQPPVGSLRFAPATAPNPAPSGLLNATSYGPICLQSSSSAQSEDCLFINIQRPSGISLKTKLPVLLFVHGGGFQSGAGSQQDGSALVRIGASANLPAVVVTINYRLGLFGFLGGSTFYDRQRANRNDVTLNAALTDVRQALRWTHMHIKAFGGDAKRITLWGQSAGSFAASAQLLASANKKPDFAGVFLESGSPGGVPVDPPSANDEQYNAVVSAANCAGQGDTVACLRNVGADALRTISIDQANLNQDVSTIPRGYYSWTMMQDGGPSNGGFYADRPSVLLSQGKFASVPVLHGDCLDEGTYFAYQGSNSDLQTADYFSRVYFGDRTDLLAQALQQYPDDPAQGSPYAPAIGDVNNRYFGVLNQYKRIASLYGDIRYQSNRRFFLQALVRKGVKAWSYEFAQYVPGNADAVGFPHGSDLSFVFGTQASNPFGDALSRQWLSFATHQTPNKNGKKAPFWYQYTAKRPWLMFYTNNGIGNNVPDDFRAAPIAFLNSPDVLAATGR